ncbi:MAG: hypothetical protein JJU13_13700 [Balneolaceae bacterium]|nr:hypothetical protein [Balneolaceae bacterium]
MTELTQLNISNFQPRVPEPDIQPEPDDPAPQEESAAETEIVEEITTPQRVDMTEILPQGVQVDLSISRSPTENTARSQQSNAEQTQSRSLRVEEAEMERIGGLQTLSGGTLTSPSANRRSVGSNGGAAGGLDIAEGGELSGGRRGVTDGGGTGGLLSGPQVRDGNREGQEVGLRDLTEFGEGYSDMDPIIHDLIKWMKENPAELPTPVRRTMGDGRWDPDFLTSRVPFIIEDRQFDLLLMVKEELLEVHIFLVESHDATYLIDRGFQETSSFLRRGSVGYQEDIVEVDSQMRAANRQHTQEFYQIFLSWWNTVKSDL